MTASCRGLFVGLAIAVVAGAGGGGCSESVRVGDGGVGGGGLSGGAAPGPSTGNSSGEVTVANTSVGTTATTGATSMSSATTSSGSASECGALGTDDPNCNDCLFQVCCSELLACDSGTPCFDLVVCLSSCQGNDLACEAQCSAEVPAGQPVLDELEACYAGPCGGSCVQNLGDGICDSGLQSASPDCDACLGASCCAEANACSANGSDVDACFECINDPSGGPLCDSLMACTVMSCPAECGN